MAVAYRLMGAMGREAGLGLKAPGTGRSPLHHAAAGGDPELVTMLLRAGYDPENSDTNGSTPLHVAGEAGHGQVVEAILRFVPQT